MSHAHVVLADPDMKGQLPRVKGLKYVYDPSRLPTDEGFLVLGLASRLEINQSRLTEPKRANVQIYLVMLDTEPQYVQISRHATGWQPPALLHPSIEVLHRVLRAWALEAEDKLVATAGIRAGNLHVRDCQLHELTVPIRDIGPLRHLPQAQLYDFEVSDSGSFIWWPEPDVHLTLDDVRYFVDPAHRQRVEAEKAEYDARYGAAIASLRKQTRLRQADIGGVTERQVRRIEHGRSTPRSETLKKLAAAHEMAFADYLSALANLASPAEFD